MENEPKKNPYAFDATDSFIAAGASTFAALDGPPVKSFWGKAGHAAIAGASAVLVILGCKWVVHKLFDKPESPRLSKDDIRAIVREGMQETGAIDEIKAMAKNATPEQRQAAVDGLKKLHDHLDKNWETMVAARKAEQSSDVVPKL